MPAAQRTLIVLAVAAIALLAAAPAEGAFPGANGKIAFWDVAGIWTVNPDGSGKTQIPAPSFGYEPAWSPDGKKLVFIHDTSAHHRDVYTMNADGSNFAPIYVSDADVLPAYPAWSPDGTQIVFSLDHPLDPPGTGRRIDLYKVNTDGTGFTQLTNTADDFAPAWSPDGTKIAFTCASTGPKICTINPTGPGGCN